MSTIPASDLVAVNPSVLAAGGSALDVIGLLVSSSTRVPIGTVQSFASQSAVSDFFGPASAEAALAATYFAGFDNSSKKPAALLIAQYNAVAVGAYLRGGDVSGLTLTQLQALSGSLNIVVDGYPFNASSVNLSAAASFSAAAGIIQTALNAADPSEASITASIGGLVTGSISTTTLTVTAVTDGTLHVGDTLSGTGITAGTTITALGTGTGGTGTYTVSPSQSAGSTAITAVSSILNVTAVGSGTLAVGQTIIGAGVTAAIITALGTGTGLTGTYTLSGAKQHVASEAMTAEGTPVTVTYDSVSGAFVVASGVTDGASSIAFATGTLAAGVKMTSATGATLSQGASAQVPATFMSAVVAANSNWVTFFTGFDPDSSGNTVKLAFAAWVTTQNDRYVYVCWDTDQSPVTSNPAAASLGQLLAANGNSGTCLLDGITAAGWDSTAGPNLAAFVCGAAASIDFTERNGRISFAYKSQAGIAATVTTQTAARNLGGNPQTADRANGYNFYGAYGAANVTDIWFQRGFVTGDFLWLDAYINQVWLNNSLQAAGLALMGGARSVPFGAVGNARVEAALADPINAGLNFGAFGPGVMSAAQIADVNADAGMDVATTIQSQGWYLQIPTASAAVRAARGPLSPRFWYLDEGSVQSISISSVAVQ